MDLTKASSLGSLNPQRKQRSVWRGLTQGCHAPGLYPEDGGCSSVLVVPDGRAFAVSDAIFAGAAELERKFEIFGVMKEGVLPSVVVAS